MRENPCRRISAPLCHAPAEKFVKIENKDKPRAGTVRGLLFDRLYGTVEKRRRRI